ncbi:hypothetical protein ACJIZ3_007475 [Penstemon smallii]|uniref:Late embryogenesis abundant protein LEA-2 subgroup domain-containing protein n=1 Tax=Penstemon smallii TaxID=265156 RepID=A0ABD3SAP3_9LAMI
MANDEGGGCCCGFCFRFIITSGFAALFLWLSLRTSSPKCSIQDFYVPALSLTHQSSNNHTLYFDLKLDNGMKDKGVRYDNISLTFYYGQNSSLPIGNYTVPGFYQGHGKKAHRKPSVEVRGVPWEAAIGAVSNGSRVAFRVGLVTRVRFKIVFWFTKRHNLVVGANVEVDGSGKKIKKKGIRLKSGAPEGRCSHVWIGLLLVLGVLVALL